MLLTTALVIAGTLVSTAINPFGALKRARLAESLNNVRQVKFACDSFAIDFDGQYPNEDTAEQVLEDMKATHSNHFFQQLFLARATQSEMIFWVKNASVCSRQKPDDEVRKDGRIALEEILKPGDCGWAYMAEQTNTSDLRRPLILDAYEKGKKSFDGKLWDDKVIVVYIDGATRAITLSKDGKLVVDGADLLSRHSAPWNGERADPVALLKQPLPAGDGEKEPAKPEGADAPIDPEQ